MFDSAALPAGAAAPQRADASGLDAAGAVAEAARAWARDFPRLWLAWLPGLLAGVLAYGVDSWLTARLGLDEPNLATGDQLRVLGIGLGLSLAAWSVQLAAWVAVAARYRRQVGGLSQAGWLSAIALGTLLALAYTGGVLLLILPLFFLHWWAYAPAALVRDGGAATTSLMTSRRFARDRGAYGFTALLFVVMMLWVGAQVIADNLALTLAGKMLGRAVLSSLFGPFVALLPAVFFLARARESADAPASSGDALPDQTAPEVARATTCPRCQTLIAFTPAAEGATEVTCSSCGRSGRVW